MNEECEDIYREISIATKLLARKEVDLEEVALSRCKLKTAVVVVTFKYSLFHCFFFFSFLFFNSIKKKNSQDIERNTMW